MTPRTNHIAMLAAVLSAAAIPDAPHSHRNGTAADTAAAKALRAERKGRNRKAPPSVVASRMERAVAKRQRKATRRVFASNMDVAWSAEWKEPQSPETRYRPLRSNTAA